MVSKNVNKEAKAASLSYRGCISLFALALVCVAYNFWTSGVAASQVILHI